MPKLTTNYKNFDSPSAPSPTPHLPCLRMMDDMLVYCRVARICPYPYIQLGGVRLCESKVSCPKTQFNDFNWKFLIRSPVHQPLGCHALHSFQTCWANFFFLCLVTNRITANCCPFQLAPSWSVQRKGSYQMLLLK